MSVFQLGPCRLDLCKDFVGSRIGERPWSRPGCMRFERLESRISVRHLSEQVLNDVGRVDPERFH
jgi:hypothetical protein